MATSLSRRVQALEEKMEGIEALRIEMRNGFEGITALFKKSIDDLRTEVRADLRAEVDGLRTEVRADLRAEVDGLRTEVRADLRAEVDGLRAEIRADLRAEVDGLRAEVRAGDEETRNQMRVLHEDVIERISRLGEKPTIVDRRERE